MSLPVCGARRAMRVAGMAPHLALASSSSVICFGKHEIP
jgi:hypothetical protein